MRAFVCTYLATVFLISLDAGSLRADAPTGWLRDYAEAKTEAKRTGKPIFAVFL